MPDSLLPGAYLVGLIAQIAIRTPFNRRRRKNRILRSQISRKEKLLFALLSLGSFFVPLVYIFTPWLNSANHSLLAWAGGLGVVLMACAIVVFWRAHVDLGQNWSPGLEIRESHSLITSGIYRHVRHPMYASQWLFAIAQFLLLQNWIAGPAGLVAFLPMYLVRVPQEEQMMLRQFGETYRAYLHRTGRVLPRWPGGSASTRN